MSSKKIIGISGSPREKNTLFMIKAVLESTESPYELVQLKNLKIEHCDGCCVCERTGKCHIEDDMNMIMEKMIEAHAIVFGSPTYYNNVSGIFKDFVDRTNPFWTTKELEGKKAGICVVGDQSINSLRDAQRAIEIYCKLQGMQVVGSVCAPRSNPKAVQKQLKELGKKLVK